MIEVPELKSGQKLLPTFLIIIILVIFSLMVALAFRLGQSGPSLIPPITTQVTPPTEEPSPISSPSLTPSPSPFSTITPTPKKRPTSTPTPISPTDTPAPMPTSTPIPSPTPLATPTAIPQADLYISEYSFDHPPVKGEPFTARIGIYNQGNAAAGGFWWEWWPTWAIRACRERIDSLVAHGGRIVTCTYTYGGWANYTTRAVADADNEVPESNEENNTKEQNVIPIH